MPKKAKCFSCKNYYKAIKLPTGVDEIFNPDWDGWCDHYREERDSDEEICEWYERRYRRKAKNAVL